MTNEVIKAPREIDGYEAFEDAIEGQEEQQPPSRIIEGALVKFTNDNTWVTRDGEELPAHLELVPINVSRVVQKWKPDRTGAEKTIILEPRQTFPDLEELNAETPQGEWTEGPDGKLRGPWQPQYLVYLLNPETMDRYTFATGTIGGGMCVRDLVEKTRWIRQFRGAKVYPVVALSDTFMKTRFGGRQRPHFLIKRWITFGGSAALAEAEAPKLAGPAAEPTKPVDTPKPDQNAAQIVQPPSNAEAMQDEIQF